MLSSSPNLTGEVHVAPDADTLFDHLGNALLGAANEAVSDRDVFHLALSGGSSPEPFYMRLVTDIRFRNLPWDKTHLWMVDERRVPESDERSNYRMIRESLLDHVPMRKRQRHPMPVLADDPAAEYEEELREVFCIDNNCLPKLDFVLLGIGEDGHTASLFPESDALHVNDRWIAVNEGEKVTPPPRVTMTYPLINAARQIAVLVTSGKKAATIRRIESQLEKGPDPMHLPITGVDPEEHGDGSLVWYLDAAAAGG